MDSASSDEYSMQDVDYSLKYEHFATSISTFRIIFNEAISNVGWLL